MLGNKFASKSLLCLSGGVDSMVLLDVMIKSLKNGEIEELHIIHVNHGISPNSLSWEGFVKDTVESYQKEKVGKLFLKTYQLKLKENGESFSELSCREKRYEKIFEYCLENNIYDIYTAHHKDDFVENNLISVFRNRIYSMLMIENGEKEICFNQNDSNRQNITIKLHKPFLLKYTKQELLDYALKHNIKYVQDESNYISDNIRNVLRNNLFSKLKEISGYQNYINSMNSFFNFCSSLVSYQNKIINEKILNLFELNKKIEKSGRVLNNNLISLELIKPYLLEKDDGKNAFFMIEIVNQLFFSYRKKYLTGKQKKVLDDFFKKTVDKGKVVIYNTKTNYLEVNLNLSTKQLMVIISESE